MPTNASTPSGENVKARPVTFAEIQALAEQPAPLDGFWLEEAGVLVPATLTLSDPQHPRAYYPPRPVQRGTETAYVPDTEAGPVGHGYQAEVRSTFGTVTQGTLFTSPEAEQSALLVRGHGEPSRTRLRFHVGDAQAGTDLALAPVYGAQVTLSAVVKGIAPDVLAARVEQVLAAEFGDALSPLLKVRSRPVKDQRVDVTDPITGEVLALNILQAEVSVVMERARGGVQVTPARARRPVIGG